MRKYSDNDRLKAALATDRKIRQGPCPYYPSKRQRGEIIKRVNGQELIVELIPKGNCTQWLAVFPDKSTVLGGMNKIDAEIRKRMPPALGIDNF